MSYIITVKQECPHERDSTYDSEVWQVVSSSTHNSFESDEYADVLQWILEQEGIDFEVNV